MACPLGSVGAGGKRGVDSCDTCQKGFGESQGQVVVAVVMEVLVVMCTAAVDMADLSE